MEISNLQSSIVICLIDDLFVLFYCIAVFRMTIQHPKIANTNEFIFYHISVRNQHFTDLKVDQLTGGSLVVILTDGVVNNAK